MEVDDDGSLGILNIPRDQNNRHFNCAEITQQRLINTEFWVCDYIEDVKTKYGSDRCLVKIKYKKEDNETDARKFFTGSQEIKYILQKIHEMKQMKRYGNLYEKIISIENLKIGVEKYKMRVSSWLGWAKHSDSKHLLKQILKTDYYESIVSK